MARQLLRSNALANSWRRKMSILHPMVLAAACVSLLAGPSLAQVRLDDTPRIAVIGAFAPELEALLARTEVERTVARNGVTFSLGKLGGKDVVVFASGVTHGQRGYDDAAGAGSFRDQHGDRRRNRWRGRPQP
jgi:hypothetical protein